MAPSPSSSKAGSLKTPSPDGGLRALMRVMASGYPAGVRCPVYWLCFFSQPPSRGLPTGYSKNTRTSGITIFFHSLIESALSTGFFSLRFPFRHADEPHPACRKWNDDGLREALFIGPPLRADPLTRLIGLVFAMRARMDFPERCARRGIAWGVRKLPQLTA